jgi:subtilisin family serine protease
LERLEARLVLSSGFSQSPLPHSQSIRTQALIQFEPAVSSDLIDAELDLLGARVIRTLPNGIKVVALRDGSPADDSLAAIRQRPWARVVEPDIRLELAEVPNDPFFASQWGLQFTDDRVDIDAPEAWDFTLGSPVLVAVIDTGIDYAHPDLYLNIAINQSEIPAELLTSLTDTNADGLIGLADLNAPANAPFVMDWNETGYIDAGDLLADGRWCDQVDTDGNGLRDDLAGWNYLAISSDARDEHSHGTHVSGTIAAHTNDGIGVAGVNGNARILPMRVGDATGGISLTAAIEAIYDAVAQGARVINASWGSGFNSTALADAVVYAGDHGTVVVAAAGNYASNNDSSPFYPASISSPNVLSVAAIDASARLASFSNYGAQSVDLGAPGQGILSTIPGGGHGYKSGTSMAAPHVAGVVSLVAGIHPEYTAAQLVDAVLASTAPLSSLDGRTRTGGLLNAADAVLLATLPPPVPLPATPWNVSATADSSSSVAVSWSSSGDATGFTVERRIAGQSSWTIVATVNGFARDYTDSGLMSSTTYEYRVIAFSPAGYSSASPIVGVTTLATKPRKGGGGKR